METYDESQGLELIPEHGGGAGARMRESNRVLTIRVPQPHDIRAARSSQTKNEEDQITPFDAAF